MNISEDMQMALNRKGWLKLALHEIEVDNPSDLDVVGWARRRGLEHPLREQLRKVGEWRQNTSARDRMSEMDRRVSVDRADGRVVRAGRGSSRLRTVRKPAVR